MNDKQHIPSKRQLVELRSVDAAYCPRFHAAVELIGRRWSGAIVLALLRGLHRFSELRDAIPGLSDRLLSERLRELEAAGIVGREVGHGVPVTVTYSLTPKGEALAPAIEALLEWAERWSDATA